MGITRCQDTGYHINIVVQLYRLRITYGKNNTL